MLPVLMLVLAAAPGDPCASVAPGPERNPDEAAAYLEVALSELNQGASDTATAAFQEVLRHQPDHAEARARLKSLCEAKQLDGLVDEGVRAMRGQRYREALEPLSRAYALNSSAGTALLLAIAYHALGQDAQAAPLLEKARRDPEFVKEAAFYQGLVAYRAGQRQEATSLFQLAQTAKPLSSAVSHLMDVTKQEGPLVLAVLAETLYDSNPRFEPDGPTAASAAKDGAADVTAMAQLALPGRLSPFLRLSGEYHKQFQLQAYDFAALGASTGVAMRAANTSLVVEYSYDWLMLGNTPYLSAHRLGGLTRLRSDVFSVGLSAAARIEDFLPMEVRPYSGVRMAAQLDVAWNGPSTLVLSAAYRGARDATSLAQLSYLEHGPALEARLHPHERVRLAASAGLLLRGYSAADPDLRLIRRSDTYLDGELFAEFFVNPELSVQMVLSGRRALSNVDALTYGRLVCALRVSYAVSLP